jgi:hypothetical protein
VGVRNVRTYGAGSIVSHPSKIAKGGAASVVVLTVVVLTVVVLPVVVLTVVY